MHHTVDREWSLTCHRPGDPPSETSTLDFFMSDEPPLKRQCRPPRRFPWCDGRFRCIHCPKALGRDGRGYSRARDVPCRNPDVHLTVNDKDNCDRYWLSDPNCVHFDLTYSQLRDTWYAAPSRPAPCRRSSADPTPRRCRNTFDGVQQIETADMPYDTTAPPPPAATRATPCHRPRGRGRGSTHDQPRRTSLRTGHWCS